MNLQERSTWEDQVLQQVLEAIAKSDELKRVLIFKGARILNLHLDTQRQSLDIDSSIDFDFHESMPDLDAEAEWFSSHLDETLSRHFEDQDPVRYTLEATTILRNPAPHPHPRGWDMLVAQMKITDHLLTGVRGLPQIRLEIAAPEKLGPGAVCQLPVDGSTVQAYTLHRIAGEKLRAYLTSLPDYRAKMGAARPARVKDLHDLARILEARPLTDDSFWADAAAEFRLACESRYVDCAGPETFHQDWDAVRIAYENDANLRQVPWTEADRSLDKILGHFAKRDTFPLSFPLPAET